jgi:hypothetical protein
MSALEDIEEIRISDNHYRSVVAHGLRKLEGDYRPDETPERKAYGLLGGRPQGVHVDITHVFCLARNARYEPAYRQQMDELMTSLAVPSETPLERRGWLTDPDELLAAERRCDAEHAVIFASDHNAPRGLARRPAPRYLHRHRHGSGEWWRAVGVHPLAGRPGEPHPEGVLRRRQRP